MRIYLPPYGSRFEGENLTHKDIGELEVFHMQSPPERWISRSEEGMLSFLHILVLFG